MKENPDFNFTFEYNGIKYNAGVWHYSQLSIKERLDYGMTEITYLIFLKGQNDYKPFEIFIGEDLEWHTKSTFIVSQELVDKIGELIDRKSK